MFHIPSSLNVPLHQLPSDISLLLWFELTVELAVQAISRAGHFLCGSLRMVSMLITPFLSNPFPHLSLARRAVTFLHPQKLTSPASPDL